MTVKELISKLQEMNEDSIVIITEPDSEGWVNIGEVFSDGCDVKISQEDLSLFC